MTQNDLKAALESVYRGETDPFLAAISPPFGVNVFVIRGVVGDAPLPTIFRSVLPFVGADIVKLALLVWFPILILWLPSTMVG